MKKTKSTFTLSKKVTLTGILAVLVSVTTLVLNFKQIFPSPTPHTDPVLAITYAGICESAIVVIPDNINPQKDLGGIVKNPQAFKIINQWSRAPFFLENKPNTSYKDEMTQAAFNMPQATSSLVKDNRKVEVEHTITLDVQIKPAPDHSNVYIWPGGCGGGPANWEFPVVGLKTSPKQYKLPVTTNEVPFFTLTPGDIQTFNFNLSCSAPSTYVINSVTTYLYSGEYNNITTKSPHEFVCPKSFTLWSDDGSGNITNKGDYKIN